MVFHPREMYASAATPKSLETPPRAQMERAFFPGPRGHCIPRRPAVPFLEARGAEGRSSLRRAGGLDRQRVRSYVIERVTAALDE
jgi:hypothetical protein